MWNLAAIDWAAVAASKAARAVMGLVLLIASYGGAYWYGGHVREATLTAKWTAQVAMANKDLENELTLRSVELEREFALREITRANTRKEFGVKLADYAKEQHETETNSAGVSVHYTGISPTGVRLIGDAIASRNGPSKPTKP